MPTAQEQEGGLGEASRLLQEGLQLLDERSREVDTLIEQAEQRAHEMTAEAERRAQEITAEAERQRLELEREVAELRAEVAKLRDELGNSSSTPAPAPPVSPPRADEAEAEPEPEVEPIDPDAPRWGRRSTGAPANQAVKRSSRPRWLPRWLPLLVLLLPVGGLVLANVSGQERARGRLRLPNRLFTYSVATWRYAESTRHAFRRHRRHQPRLGPE